MNIIERIAASNFIATVANVESLAREHATARTAADRTGATYLHILIACTQQRISESRSRRKNALDALEAIHKELYPAVLKGVAVGSESSKETNRRATFARTNKSTLAAYLKAGKSIADLVPGETSKRQLRAAIAPPPAESRTVRIMDASKASIIRAVEREARRDLVAARRSLERVIDELVLELDGLKDDDEKVEVTGARLTREPPRIHHHA